MYLCEKDIHLLKLPKKFWSPETTDYFVSNICCWIKSWISVKG